MDKTNHNYHNGQNGFGNGFLLGAILGGLTVFLLGTEKGRKLLKTLAEGGIEGITDFENFFQEDEEISPIRKKSSSTNGHVKEESTLEKIATTGISKVTQLAETAAKAADEAAKVSETFEKKTKRFFRGIPKRKLN